MLWVSHQDRVAKLNPFVKANGIPDYVFDPDDKMSRSFGMNYGGGIVFVNKEGIVKSRVPKGISPQRMEDEINKILH